MEISKPVTSDDDHLQHPHDSIDSVHQSVDDVTSDLNHLQIDANGASVETTDDKLQNEGEKEEEEEEDEDIDEEEEEEEEEEEGEFTFVCIGENDSQTNEEFEEGQIRQMFPLFDQSLLLGGDYDQGRRRLPITVPVDNVFIQSPRRSPSRDGETDGVGTGTFCALSKESDTGAPEINIKSNSTGFSKLFRFRDKMNRSHSDGRDAFVFLDSRRSSDRATATTSSSSSSSSSSNSEVIKPDVVVAGTTVKVNGTGVGKGKAVKKGSKVKKVKASAHEVYLKQRGGQTEEERRKSYLPYRPGLMGFFTNVNGGLSRNVHPF